MIETLKILHFLALALGVGGGFAGLFLGVWATNETAEFKAKLAPMQAKLARLGFFSLVLLWVSGLLMTHISYDWFTNGWPLSLWIKLLLVLLLSAISIVVQLVRIGALPSSLLANPARRTIVSQTASAIAALIIIFAVFAFN